MLMPLLKEMPGGPEGTAISKRAVHFVLFFVACLAYGTVGVFGASIYGQETKSNIMVNDILSDPTYTLVLYAALIICERIKKPTQGSDEGHFRKLRL